MKNVKKLIAMLMLLTLGSSITSTYAVPDIRPNAITCGACNKGYVVPFTKTEEVHAYTTACDCSNSNSHLYNHYYYRTRTTSGTKCGYCNYEKSTTTVSPLSMKHVRK